MRVIIEIDRALDETEVTIRCSLMNNSISDLQKVILNAGNAQASLVFYKDSEEFYFPVGKILFFQTEQDSVWAHTEKEAYKSTHRLRELEDILPHFFVRVSKSTIVNTSRIHSIKRSLTSSSLVTFTSTHKHVYVSRLYYQTLRQRIIERD